MSKTLIKTASALAILASVGIPAVTVGVDVANAAEQNAVSDFVYTVANGQVTITAYKGTNKDVIIPSEIGDNPVTAIGTQAFYNKGLTSVVIPEKVTAIEGSAFRYNKLTSVTIPASTSSIGNSAFADNSQLVNFIVKSNNVAYGAHIFNERQNVVIRAAAGSTSEKYATEFGHSFVPTDFSGGTGSGNEGNDGSAEGDSGNGETGSETPTEGKTHHSDKATVKLKKGILNLDIASVLDFGTVQLEAQPKTVTTGFGDFFGVIDTRGTQQGWRVDVTATPFKIVEPAGGFKSGTSAHVLPVGSLSISPLVGIDRVGQSSGAMPKGTLSGKTILDDGAITVASAGVGEGMGQFKLEFGNEALSLIVDATTAKIDDVNYPDGITPYESTITWDLVSGP